VISVSPRVPRGASLPSSQLVTRDTHRPPPSLYRSLPHRAAAPSGPAMPVPCCAAALPSAPQHPLLPGPAIAPATSRRPLAASPSHPALYHAQPPDLTYLVHSLRPTHYMSPAQPPPSRPYPRIGTLRASSPRASTPTPAPPRPRRPSARSPRTRPTALRPPPSRARLRPARPSRSSRAHSPSRTPLARTPLARSPSPRARRSPPRCRRDSTPSPARGDGVRSACPDAPVLPAHSRDR
jgi:hypothetical protein